VKWKEELLVVKLRLKTERKWDILFVTLKAGVDICIKKKNGTVYICW